MKLLEGDAAHLWDMLDAARQARVFSDALTLEQLLEDARTRYAIERVLEIIGEAARRVSPETRERLGTIPWQGIIGFRNVLAHEYGAIDYQRLFTVLRDDLPALVDALDQAISQIERNPSR